MFEHRGGRVYMIIRPIPGSWSLTSLSEGINWVHAKSNIEEVFSIYRDDFQRVDKVTIKRN
jgi:hypothetical protein